MMKIVRVAVTGHRWTKISHHYEDDIRASFSRTFEDLSTATARFVLVTGMAEGADILAAQARPSHWRLEPVLALSEDRWRTHLSKPPARVPQDRELFDALMEHADPAVVAPNTDQPDFGFVAEHIINTCDCIVSLWNGQPGKPGGTADVIARAGEHGVPVSVIWQDHWASD